MARGCLNKVTLIGNLGADPDLRFTPSGVQVASCSLATSESWKNKNGEPQERTEWHRLVLWRRLAEIAGQYLKKGSKIYVEGKLQTRSWEDQKGQRHYMTEILANRLEMLDAAGTPAELDMTYGQGEELSTVAPAVAAGAPDTGDELPF
ncbi:MAG: single-stranded DNA-binding protein [Candidatus Latescibacteria bacterium]|nr:single-stranded DNA-binding protein [Candidatus Latescibacterota bacterium]